MEKDIFKDLNYSIEKFKESHDLFETIGQRLKENKGIFDIEFLDGTKIRSRVKNIAHNASFDSGKMTITVILIDDNDNSTSYNLKELKSIS